MKDIKTYNVIAQEGLDELPADMYTVNKSTKPDALLIEVKICIKHLLELAF